MKMKAHNPASIDLRLFLSGVFDAPVYTSKNTADIGTSIASPFV